MRKWGVLVAVLGLLMVTGAAALRFVVVPNGQTLPSDTDEKVEYAGTLTAVDPAALQSGDVKGAVVRDLAVTVDRHLEVLETEGDQARVVDSSLVTASESGEVVSEREYYYAVDRKTLHAVPNFSGEPVEDAEGLAIGFPIGAEKLNYVGWVQEAEDTAHVMYQGETEVRGLAVYEYGGSSRASPPKGSCPARLRLCRRGSSPGCSRRYPPRRTSRSSWPRHRRCCPRRSLWPTPTPPTTATRWSRPPASSWR